MLCKQPPFHKQRRRRKIVPPFQNHPSYLEDPLTNLKIEDIISRKPGGFYGSTSPQIVDKFFKHGEILKRLPSLFDKMCEFYYLEDNMWYHNLDLPLLFPETIEFAQHITRTNLHHISALSLHTNETPSSLASVCIEHLIEDELHLLNRPYRNPLEVSQTAQEIRIRDRQEFLCSLMECIHNKLAYQYPNSHIMSENNQINNRAKLETFFKRAGYADFLEDHSKDQTILEGLWQPHSEIMLDADGLLRFRLRGELAWQLRGRNLLAPFVPMNDASCFSTNLPTSLYRPELYGLEIVEGHTFSCLPFSYNKISSEYIRSIAGHWATTPFWNGDQCEFGLLGVLDVAKNEGLRFDLSNSTLSETEKTSIISRHELSEGILAAFAWASAIAFNQGFTIYNELTYPIPVQLLLTDGRHFQLLCFQLNSLTSLWKAEDAGLPFNMAWYSDRLPLYEDNSVGRISINPKAVALIESSLLRAPLCNPPEVDILRPYLCSKPTPQRFIPISATGDSATETGNTSADALLTEAEKKALLMLEGNESRNDSLRIKNHRQIHVNDVFFLKQTEKSELLAEFRERMPIFGGRSMILPEKHRRIMQEYDQNLRSTTAHRKVLRGPRRWR